MEKIVNKFHNIYSPFRKPAFLLLVTYFIIGITFGQDTTSQSKQPVTKTEASVFQKKLVFMPGDAIEIQVYPDTISFPNGIYPIDDQGYAFLPVLGYTKVINKTAPTIEKLLTDVYVNFLPQPNLQVRPLIRASALGGFHEPGLYYIDPRENIWSLIERAGGTEREDGLEKIEWKRSDVTVAKDLIPYIESGKSLNSIGFKSGDQLLVTYRPRQRFWDIFRADVLPVLTITLSAIASVSTAYIAYQTFQERN